MSWKLHRIPWINPISSARMPMCTCYLLQHCFKTSRFGAKQQTSLQHPILRHSDWRSMGKCGKSCPNPKVSGPFSGPFCKQATREVPKREAALLQQQVVLAVKGINVWISTTSSVTCTTLWTIWMASCSCIRSVSGAAGWVRLVSGAYTWYIDHCISTAACWTFAPIADRALAYGIRPLADGHAVTSVTPLTSQQHFWVVSKRNCSASLTGIFPVANHGKCAAVLEVKVCVAAASCLSYAIYGDLTGNIKIKHWI